jgi:hypothetical protein
MMSFIYVIEPDVIHIQEGPIGVRSATPAGLLTDLPFLLSSLATKTPLAAEITVTLPDTPCDPEKGRDGVLTALRANGWAATETAGGWFRAQRDRRVLNLGIRAWCPDDPMIGSRISAADAAKALWFWHAGTGTHYVHTPGVSAVINLRQHPRAAQPDWILQNRATAEYWQPPAHIRDIKWQAAKTLRPGRYHRFDMRSAYLAGAAGATLPWGRLRPTGVDHHGQLGYYRVCLHPADTGTGRIHWPAAIRMLGGVDRQNCMWITHVQLNHLLDHPIAGFEIVDSWTAPSGGRILRGWAENWRDAIAIADRNSPVARAALKRGYAEMLGLLNVASGTVYRPDWRHMIIDQVRANLLRKIGRVEQLTGAIPAKIDVDSVWYHDDDLQETSWENFCNAIDVNSNMGRMRYEGIERIGG